MDAARCVAPIDRGGRAGAATPLSPTAPPSPTAQPSDGSRPDEVARFFLRRGRDPTAMIEQMLGTKVVLLRARSSSMPTVPQRRVRPLSPPPGDAALADAPDDASDYTGDYGSDSSASTALSPRRGAAGAPNAYRAKRAFATGLRERAAAEAPRGGGGGGAPMSIHHQHNSNNSGRGGRGASADDVEAAAAASPIVSPPKLRKAVVQQRGQQQRMQAQRGGAAGAGAPLARGGARGRGRGGPGAASRPLNHPSMAQRRRRPVFQVAQPEAPVLDETEAAAWAAVQQLSSASMAAARSPAMQQAGGGTAAAAYEPPLVAARAALDALWRLLPAPGAASDGTSATLQRVHGVLLESNAVEYLVALLGWRPLPPPPQQDATSTSTSTSTLVVTATTSSNPNGSEASAIEEHSQILRIPTAELRGAVALLSSMCLNGATARLLNSRPGSISISFSTALAHDMHSNTNTPV